MKTTRILLALAALTAGLSQPGVLAAEQRFWLASQHDWAAKQGFYLNFECRQRDDDPVCRLADLGLYLGIADGVAWRFAALRSPWEYGREYVVKAVVGGEASGLCRDDQPAVPLAGGFVPASQALTLAHVPEWAAAPAEYRIVQTALSVSAADVEPLVCELRRGSAMHPGLTLFGGDESLVRQWHVPAGRPLEVIARFRIEKAPVLQDLAPLIDRYGQCRFATWEGKVTADDDLRQDLLREETRLQEMPVRSDGDVYGGWTQAGWREEGTGFFRIVRRNRHFWLITPAGNPCFYTGINTMPATTWERTPVAGRESLFAELPPREGPWAAAWSRDAWGGQDGDYVCLYTANLLRKYGHEAWETRAVAQAIKRTQAWGFSGGGKWGSPPGLVSTPVLHRGGVPVLAGHPDVFDPAVCRLFRNVIAGQIAPRRRDPLVLGWSLGNEMDEVIRTDEVRAILRLGADVPAKRGLVDFALADRPSADVGAGLASAWLADGKTREPLYREPLEASPEGTEVLRQFYADRYYDFVYRTVKEIDPDHLYLGFWLSIGWWENEQDWFLSARHCDVVGYDRYAPTFTDERFSRLLQAVDRPVLCGEFSFPPTYAGRRGFGRYGTNVETEAQAGDAYREWIRAAAASPWCVGSIWFHYRDQAITGRGPGHGNQLVYGEHYAFGVITETDRPKWDLVSRMRDANLQAAAWRAEAARP